MNRRRPGRPEAGMVTVEIAFAVMAAAVVALGLAYLIALVIQLGELHAVAGEVARQQARGDVAAAERAERGAPSGTRLQVGRDGGDVVVVAELRAAGVQPWGRWIPAMPLSARAVVAKEGA